MKRAIIAVCVVLAAVMLVRGVDNPLRAARAGYRFVQIEKTVTEYDADGFAVPRTYIYDIEVPEETK